MRNKVVIIKKGLVPIADGSAKDFQSVLNQHSDYIKLIKQYYLAGGLILIATLLSGLFFYSGSKPSSADATESILMTDLEPIYKSNLDLAQSSEILTIYDSIKSIKSKEALEKQNDNKSLKVTTSSIENKINRTAEPVKGFSHLYEYLNNNISYPEIHKLDSIEGIVKIAFTVKKDSSITRISVIESLGENFDKEAIRLIKNMPTWRPAMHNGKVINQRLSIPIRFNYNKGE